MARILVIEDDETLRFTISKSLGQQGHEVLEAASVASAESHLAASEVDLVLTDVNLGNESGLGLVERLRREGYAGGLVVMTGYASIESAVRAMKSGANDYLEKPLRLEELSLLVDRLLEQGRVRTRLRYYERRERSDAREIVGKSEVWMAALSLAERLATIPVERKPEGATGGAIPTILILGETGTGKGVLARRIHDSACAKAGVKGGELPPPYVHVNCSALPPTLVEAELFGHEKGAFTDAKGSREGYFEMAEGGTIFLDEIAEMPLDLQAKLLTVVEEGVYRRVGSSRDRHVKARLITATNQDLEKRVSEGKFRNDLYFRLSVFPLKIPPLRARGEDGVLIAEAMLSRFAKEFARPRLGLSEGAKAAIRSHGWPGNTRELINAVQRAAMLGDRPLVEASDLGLAAESRKATAISAAAGRQPLVFDFEHGVHTADEVEKELIMQALRKTNGNVSRAARLIGMQRSSFRYRIERFHLEEAVREIART